eukprot:92466-Prymnesium_polylepis.1
MEGRPGHGPPNPRTVSPDCTVADVGEILMIETSRCCELAATMLLASLLLSLAVHRGLLPPRCGGSPPQRHVAPLCRDEVGVNLDRGVPRPNWPRETFDRRQAPQTPGTRGLPQASGGC